MLTITLLSQEKDWVGMGGSVGIGKIASVAKSRAVTPVEAFLVVFVPTEELVVVGNVPDRVPAEPVTPEAEVALLKTPVEMKEP
jgi:hypothetical protein